MIFSAAAARAASSWAPTRAHSWRAASELFLQPGPRSVALGQQGRELCGASSLEHAPDNRRGRDGDEQGDQRQVQVHDGRFTTLRLFFAGSG